VTARYRQRASFGRPPERRAAAASAASPDIPGVLLFPPLLYAIAFVVGLLAQWAKPATILAPAIALPTGLVLLALGGALAAWGRRTMLRAGTNVNPASPAKALVVSGPFVFSRNPLYVARTLLYLGLAFAMNTSWPLVTLLPLLGIMHYGVIRREERYLDATFGTAYRQYQKRVGRWL
jgi:protein-S-isoprenylcysteine O-methyltransferase Ste14